MEEKCSTKVNVLKITYTWEIINFSVSVKGSDCSLVSSTFTDLHKITSWYLQFFPKGRNECYSKNDYLPIALYLLNYEQELISTNFSLSVLDSKGNKCFEQKRNYNQNYIYNFLSKKDLTENIIVNDTLTIVCEIKSGLNITNEVSSFNSTVINENLEELSKGLKILIENAKFSDATIIVKEKKFYVHKAILSARSPVFQAMFEHDMKEKNSNLIKIEDAEHDAIAEMLHYIYTGKVENLEKLAYELLILSDRYALEGLKTMCSEVIGKSLTTDNALSILNLSKVHRSDKLKTLTNAFIAKHGKEITDLPNFKSLLPKDTDLCAEIFQALCNINC